MDTRSGPNTDPSVLIEPFDRFGAFVIATGSFDAGPEVVLRDAVTSAITAGYRQLVVDFSDATFFDSGAFRVLVETVAALDDVDDSAVLLVGLHGAVERVVELLDADRILPRYADRSAARRALQMTSRRTAWR